MPAFVRTKSDEKRWARAKEAASKTLSEADGDRYWALVTHIYKKMTKSQDVAAIHDALMKARRLLSDEPEDPYDQEPGLEEAGFREFDPEMEEDEAAKWLEQHEPETEAIKDEDINKDSDYSEYEPEEDDAAHRAGIQAPKVSTAETKPREERPSEISKPREPSPEEAPKEEAKVESRFPQPSKQDIAEMRQYTRPWEQRARESSRLSAEAAKNPILHGEGKLIEARNTAHKSHREAYESFKSSPEYMNADPITQMEMDSNFEKEFHSKNPDYLSNAAKLHQEAHSKGEAAKDVHAAAKQEQIEHVLQGGMRPETPMSMEEALQHAGGAKGEEGTEGTTVQDPASSFARGNKEFLKQYAKDYAKKAKKPTNIGEMTQYDEGSKADIHRVLGDHPALKDPAKKAKVDSFFKDYHPLIGMSAAKVVNKLGVDKSKVDLGMLHEAGMHGLFQAINDYDHDHPSKATFATHAGNKIRGLMQTALKAQDQVPAELRAGAKKFAQSPTERKDVSQILKKPLHPEHQDRLSRITTALKTKLPKPEGE